MDIVVAGFKGEIPILDVKALPETFSSEAVNCDFVSGALRTLLPFDTDIIFFNSSDKLFFLAGTDTTTIRALLVDDDFQGVPAPVINDERVVFVYFDSGPKKARLVDIGLIGEEANTYKTGIQNVRSLGLPRPTSPLIATPTPSRTNYFAHRVYYLGDIVHWEVSGGGSDLYICRVLESKGAVGDVWDETLSASNWTRIWKDTQIRNAISTESYNSHEKLWILNEGTYPINGAKQTGPALTQALSQEDLVEDHVTNDIYQAKFDYINRTRIRDPHCWNFIIDVSELLNLEKTLEHYNFRLYSPDRTYSRGDICLKLVGNRYFWFCCNVSGTQGVNPEYNTQPGSGKWGLICAWHHSDNFATASSPYGIADGLTIPLVLKDEDDNTVMPSPVDTMLPYLTTYAEGQGNPWYSVYKYINTNGVERFGIFEVRRANSNIRPFNPEWGGENPWILYKTKEEVAIDRSEVYDAVSYCYTWVSDWGEESAPSEPTYVIDSHRSEYMTVAFPNITVGTALPEGNPLRHVTGIRLYRLSGGLRSSEYILYQNEDLPTTQLNSDFLDRSEYGNSIKEIVNLASEPIQTEDWDEPKSTLKGFVSLANGCLAGYTGNELYFSESWVYYAFPNKYQVAVHSEVVGLGAFNNTVVACTLAHPEVITCPLPGQISVAVSPHTQPCLSPSSIVSGENYVIYAGHNGLIAIGQDGIPKNLTKSLIDEKSWVEDFKPEDISAVYFNGQYWAVIKGTKRGFVLPFNTPDHITQIDVSGVDGFPNLSGISINSYTGEFYLIGKGGAGPDVHVLNFNVTGTYYLDWSWTSKLFIADHYVGHSAGKVDRPQGNTNNITLSYYGDGTERLNTVLNSNSPFRLPPGRYKEIQFKLEGDSEAVVNFVKFATTMTRI